VVEAAWYQRVVSSWLSAIHGMAGVLEARAAEPGARAALARDEVRFGSDHPAMCIRLVELASLLGRLGRASEGEPLVERAVRISERTNGLMHAATGHMLLLLAQLQTVSGSAGAVETASRAADTLRRTVGPQHVTTLAAESLVAAQPTRPMDRSIVADLDHGVETLRSRNPEGSIDLLLPVADRARAAQNPALESYARGMLAQAMFLAGRRPDAVLEAKRAIEVATNAGHDDAAQHFRALLEHMEGAPDPSSPSMVDYNARIRGALDRAAAGDPGAAFQEISAVAQAAKQGGADGPEASARIVLGQIYSARGQRDLAEGEFRRALQLSRHVGDTAVINHVTRLLEKLGTVA
jgi:hypothetical protein